MIGLNVWGGDMVLCCCKLGRIQIGLQDPKSHLVQLDNFHTEYLTEMIWTVFTFNEKRCICLHVVQVIMWLLTIKAEQAAV